MVDKKQKKSKWGYGIAALYGSFVIFMLTAVIFSVSQDFIMVEDNYYQKSLVYQDKIDQMQNTSNLLIKPFHNIDKDENLFLITFPDSLAINGITGTAYFFRPSDKRLDQVVEITIDDNSTMKVPTTRFLKGLWVMKLSWESSGITYYQEENLTF